MLASYTIIRYQLQIHSRVETNVFRTPNIHIHTKCVCISDRTSIRKLRTWAKRYCGVRTDKRHLHLYTKPNGIIRKHCSTYCFICAKQSTLFLAKFIDHTHILIILLHSLFGSHAVCCFALLRFVFGSIFGFRIHIAKVKPYTCHLCSFEVYRCVVLSCVWNGSCVRKCHAVANMYTKYMHT